MSSNVFNDLSNSDILFINILNAIYNDNLRMIHHLMDHNNEITSILISIMNNRRRTNIGPSNRSSNRNSSENQRRFYVDHLPYLDNIEIVLPTSITERNGFTRTTRNNMPSNSNVNLNMNSFSRILNSFLEPINIAPTREQIEDATRNIIYGDILDPINNSCPISLEQFMDSSNVTMIRHCRHIFNTNSLMSWFNSNCKCPVCRYDIRDYRTNNNNNANNNANNTSNINNNSTVNEENNDNTSNYIDNDNNYPENERYNNERRENNSTNRANRTNIRSNINNILENMFTEDISDLSSNNIEYILDNNSLFTLLYPLTRRGTQPRR